MNAKLKKMLSTLGTFMMGLLLVVTGVLFFIFKDSAFDILIILVGAVYFIYGCIDIFSLKDIEKQFRKWAITNTLIEIVLGLIMVIIPWFVKNVMGLVVGIVLIAYSTALIIEALVYRPKGLIAKILLYSIVTLLFGVLFLMEPQEFGGTIIIIIGSVSILAGIVLCKVSISMSKKTNVIDQQEIEESIDTYEQEEVVSSNQDDDNSESKNEETSSEAETNKE